MPERTLTSVATLIANRGHDVIDGLAPVVVDCSRGERRSERGS